MKEQLKRKIRTLLETNLETRDNDNLLISLIWESELNHNNLATFFEDFKNGKHTSSESIRRARQKLQEQNEELRGVTYNDRQRKGHEVRQTINK